MDNFLKTIFVFDPKEKKYNSVECNDYDYWRKWWGNATDEDGNLKSDYDCMLFKDCQIKVDKEGLLWTMSDDSLDRDMERFDSSGWNLKTFKKNPVVLWGHDQDRPAIGKVLNPKVIDKALVGRIKFSSAEVDPFAAMVEAKVKEGIISAGSVGFKPMKVELVDDEKDPCRLIYRKQELREFSICNVPANPNAVYNPEKQIKDLGTVKVQLDDELQDQLDEIKGEIETLKDMQMKQAEKKKEVTYFDKIFSQEKEPKTNWFENTFLKK